MKYLLLKLGLALSAANLVAMVVLAGLGRLSLDGSAIWIALGIALIGIAMLLGAFILHTRPERKDPQDMSPRKPRTQDERPIAEALLFVRKNGTLSGFADGSEVAKLREMLLRDGLIVINPATGHHIVTKSGAHILWRHRNPSAS